MMKESCIFVTVLLFLFSCQEENYELERTHPFPRIQTRTISSFDESQRCVTPAGDTIPSPWAYTSTGTIPHDIRMDVKESEGWRLLYSNMKIVNYSHTPDIITGANYIILYNKYSGMLKGFYYANSMPTNNNAYWVLTIPQSNTKLFNFGSDFAVPANSSHSQQIILSNVSKNGVTNGFDIGWNCFMQELAYDSNSQNETLEIMAYTLNNASYNFTGAYQSTSEGTIVTSSVNTPSIVSATISGTTKAIGDSAKNWIVNNTITPSKPNKPIKKKLASSFLQNFVSNPLPAFLSEGLNTVFGSIFGKDATTTQHIEFSTTGSVQVTGSSSEAQSGYIMPIQGIPLNALGEDLGVWNLAEAPKYQVKNAPELINMRNESTGIAFWYKVVGIPSINIVKNPAVACSKNTSFSLVKYDLYNGSSPNFWSYKSGINSSSLITVIPQYSPSLIYDDSSSKIWNMPYTYIVQTYDNYPNKTTQSNIPAYDFANSNFEIREKIAFKIVTTISCTSNLKYYSCKTFIPRNEILHDGTARPYNWNYNGLVKAGYLYAY